MVGVRLLVHPEGPTQESQHQLNCSEFLPLSSLTLVLRELFQKALLRYSHASSGLRANSFIRLINATTLHSLRECW